ncbi:MAG: hypothetical protein LUE27_07535 [Clostridia bacterium]|nr:hypothetical protein [Clostridia bacterium]
MGKKEQREEKEKRKEEKRGGKGPRRASSFEIALSAISCAVAAAFLALGILSGVLLATGYFIGVIALMLPLAKQFYRGDFLAYCGTVILTVILGAVAKFWDLVPFIMFFGLHPLINALQLRYRWNRVVAFILKAIWFDCTLIAGYFLIYNGFLGGNFLPEGIAEWLNKYIYLVIFVGGTVLFFIYDWLIFKVQMLVNMVIGRIKRQ